MTQDYFEHVAKKGERWDLIAHQYYQDATLIAPILKANRHLLANSDRPAPLIFDAKTKLKIPVLDQQAIAQNALPPWKKS